MLLARGQQNLFHKEVPGHCKSGFVKAADWQKGKAAAMVNGA
jgi:hypothetical protein